MKIILSFLIFFLIEKIVYGTSLWDEKRGNIFIDKRPKYIGDRIVVIIHEVAEGENKSITAADKEAKASLGLSGILNLTPSDFKTKTDYKGSQRTSRGGRIIAKVTAKVISVLENGYLQILGKKTIRINNREEVIEVSGVANPLDIAQDGSILSTKLIDAKIEYKGDLKFSHKERPGFFSRIISKIISILF